VTSRLYRRTSFLSSGLVTGLPVERLGHSFVRLWCLWPCFCGLFLFSAILFAPGPTNPGSTRMLFCEDLSSSVVSPSDNRSLYSVQHPLLPFLFDFSVCGLVSLLVRPAILLVGDFFTSPSLKMSDLPHVAPCNLEYRIIYRGFCIFSDSGLEASLFFLFSPQPGAPFRLCPSYEKS